MTTYDQYMRDHLGAPPEDESAAQTPNEFDPRDHNRSYHEAASEPRGNPTDFNQGLSNSSASTPAEPTRLKHVLNTLKQFATLSEVLRIVGAIIIAGSLSLFMLQGWQEGNDISRYLKLLAQTLLLTAGGFGLSTWLKETKGARLFFGLGLASVAANFTILGALIYSIIPLDNLATSYPDYAAWVGQSPLQVSLITLLALALLVPITRLAYTVLARPAAKWLTLAYLGGNALLLLPIRSSILSSIMAVGLIFAIGWLMSRQRSETRAPDTTEAKFSKLVLLLPPIILCVRSFYFYSIETLAIGAMSIAAFVLMRQWSLRSESSRVQTTLDTLSIPLALFASATVASGLLPTIAGWALLPVFAFGLMPFVAELTYRRRTSIGSLSAGVIGASSICAALIFNQLISSSFTVALTGLIGCVLVAVFGYWIKRAHLLYMGMAATAAVAVINIGNLFKWIDLNNWVLLSVLGASAIIVASLLDRYGAVLKLKLEAVRTRSLRA